MENEFEATSGAEFSAEEQAYFESRGNPPAAQPKTEAQEAAQPEAEEDRTEELAEAVQEAEGKRTSVSHRALHEERERRKSAEERARSLELENARAIARLEALLEANKPKEEAKEPAETPQRPRADEDVFKTADYAVEKAESALERLERIEAERREAEEMRQLAETVQENVNAFLEEAPDYHDALRFMRDSRAREIKRWNPKATDKQIGQAIAREEARFVKDAMARGLDPVRMAYETATDRGYTKKAAPAPAANTGESDAVKKLETVAAGQKAGQSLSGTGGGAPTGGLSAKDILSMSDEEFLAFEANSKNSAKLRRLMGGR